MVTLLRRPRLIRNLQEYNESKEEQKVESLKNGGYLQKKRYLSSETVSRSPKEEIREVPQAWEVEQYSDSSQVAARIESDSSIRPKSALDEHQVTEKSIVTLTDHMEDLKEQVKEELARNDKMEKKLGELVSLRETMKERDAQVATLQAEIEEKALVLSHARMTLKAEREEVKSLRAKVDERSAMQEDLALTQAESLTLKHLLIGKDTLLVQKTQALDLAKELIRELDKSGQATAALQSLDQQRALYPQGAHFNDPDKKLCLKNGSMEEFEMMNKLFTMGSKAEKNFPQSVINTNRDLDVNSSGDHGQGILETILRKENSHMKRSVSASSVKSTHCPRSKAIGNGEDKDAKNVSNKNHHERPRPRTAIVKPQNYQANQPFSNFRTFRSEELGKDKQVRLKLNRSESLSAKSPNRISRRLVKPKWDVSTGTGASGGQAQPGQAWPKMNDLQRSQNSPSACREDLSLFERDAIASKFVHLGDRVIIDLAMKKEDKKELVQGVVRFIGHVDKEIEDFHVHVGIKLDEPVGDMDGVYKGKRYFTVLAQHGKLVRISKIKAVLHSKASTFQSLEECIQSFRRHQATGFLSTSSLDIKSRKG